ncbi:hypothetical protein GUJ93_ZPchr0014g47604 [Zizania palustris]|uniref:Uncharacterized protein n=1 Tax=Zizania palustris TaxID=103762 RepID=A0A8J5T8B7_ZIZPA|nr:hypothetical protein GUJ93_ZPchr0014g47604 [Zizania palustris]
MSRPKRFSVSARDSSATRRRHRSSSSSTARFMVRIRPREQELECAGRSKKQGKITKTRSHNARHPIDGMLPCHGRSRSSTEKPRRKL